MMYIDIYTHIYIYINIDIYILYMYSLVGAWVCGHGGMFGTIHALHALILEILKYV